MVKPRTRGPYEKMSIVHLEALLDKYAHDPDIRRRLSFELEQRPGKRAEDLLKKIKTIGPPGPSDNREPPPPVHTATVPDTHSATALLALWTALEALSPQTYRRPEDLAGGDLGCVARLSSRGLPWQAGEKPNPDCALYYLVPLGAILMDKATDALMSVFGTNEDAVRPLNEKAIIAAVLVNSEGIPVAENGLAVSSFPWALPLALEGTLEGLGDWPKAEPGILEKLREILCHFDKEGNQQPLDARIIDEAFRALVEQFALPDTLVEPPSLAIRIHHQLSRKSPPDVPLLNSFFLGDLSRVSSIARKNALPKGLRRYLGVEAPTDISTLLQDTKTLEQAVAPSSTPLVRWPGKGSHPLVMLQQAAVNLIRQELSGHQEGLVAVNGPPGTGKTTLLRDIVAACVLDRAEAMCTFDTPSEAFAASGKRAAPGDRDFFYPYALDPALKGHEILVASSNNKAVENISRELPSRDAVRDGPRYFEWISEHLYRATTTGKNKEAPEQDTREDEKDPATWGLIAAVLGNSKNRSTFTDAFWWNKQMSFRMYLKAAKGDPVTEKDSDDGIPPAICLLDPPPVPEEAAGQWRKAKARFQALKKQVAAEMAELEKIRQACVGQDDDRINLDNERQKGAAQKAQREELYTRLAQLRQDIAPCEQDLAQSHAALRRHRQDKPDLFARLSGHASWRQWSAINSTLEAGKAQAERARSHIARDIDHLQDQLRSLEWEIQKTRTRIAQMEDEEKQRPARIKKAREQLGNRIVDASILNGEHRDKHLCAPWIPDDLHKKREDLFLAALDVHRAFIDAAAHRVLHNLSILVDVMAGRVPEDEQKKALLGDLWSTLFMIIPVLSTTFASLGRMLGPLPAGSIGWLLVDEAGQALPQAAAGAIMRARRSIVVGDPLQITPVTTLPERLVAGLCRALSLEPSLWTAPEASAQILADRASRYQGHFRSDRGPRVVGIPLLVHRRCQDPMFTIANRIAYDGQMVHAVAPYRPDQTGQVLGASCWFDVRPEPGQDKETSDPKWSPAEGRMVIQLLEKLATHNVINPSLFIVTPFRSVAHKLQEQLRQNTGLVNRLGLDKYWVQDRVGTIHTVQGQEAETVFLVLGAPLASRDGARQWAAGTPNILNVAVSRARQNLYVIGSCSAWSGTGHASELDRLPVHGNARVPA